MKDKQIQLSYLNDDIFKKFISLEDEASIFFTKQLIYLITGIKVDSIEKVDRERNRVLEDSKRSYVDFLAKIDDRFINIEIQKHLESRAILPKIQMYQAQIFASQRLKGINPKDYTEVITIIFFEDTYVNDEYLVTKYAYQNESRGEDPYGKLSTYFIELGKINAIFKRKGIEKMDKLEKICFAIKNSDNPSFSVILKVIEESEDEVKIMKEKYDVFRSAIAEYMTEINREMKEVTTRDYFMNKGIGLGQINVLSQLIKTKYNEDAASWLNELNDQQIETLTTLILQDITYEELKKQVVE